MQKMSEEQLKDYRKKALERKRKSRAAKKAEAVKEQTNTNVSVSPYQRPQSIGKAMNKSLRSLPHSPNKRRFVVAGLAKHVGLSLEKKMVTGIGGKQKLDEKIFNAVKEFFFFARTLFTQCQGCVTS